MNYKESGVNVNFANELLQNLKMDFGFSKFFCNQVTNNSILQGNDYCSCIDINPLKYNEPVLTFSTDGVGSKLILSEQYSIESDITQDLFGMIFNDIICSGSKPLYLLDYYATHSLEEKVFNSNRFDFLLKNLTKLCVDYNIGLIGGETAEIPRIYTENKYDFAGFGIGIVEKSKLITPEKIKYDDVIIGIESSGPHSNGYSLINKIIETIPYNYEFIKQCLIPTRLYIKPILELVNKIDVHGIAHITGGGFENLSRIVPNNFCSVIDTYTWKFPEIFSEIQEYSNISKGEMFRTFNCGIGMIVVVSEQDREETLSILNSYYKAFQIGRVKYNQTQGNNSNLVLIGEK